VKKTSINSIYPNMWVPTASLLQGLNVMRQCVYQIKFRNVCKVKKRLVQPGLVWNKTLSILLSVNGESLSLPVFAQWANTSSNFTADNWMKCQPKCQKY